MPRTILVVDDEPNMRRTLRDILDHEGYDVSTAESGEQAVRLCRTREFDLVLMDVRMPGIDGLEAFRQIRRRREGARIALMSGYAVEQLELAAMREGVLAFLRKPMDPAEMLALIATW